MNLQKADLILYPVTPSSSWLDKMIGAAQFLMGYNMAGIQYEHCAIYAGNEMIFQAKWPKTGKYRIDRTRPFEAWRIRQVTEPQRARILEEAVLLSGRWYDIPALLTAGLIQIRHTEVCSQYLADVLKLAGIIKNSFRFVTPDQILKIVPADRVIEATHESNSNA